MSHHPEATLSSQIITVYNPSGNKNDARIISSVETFERGSDSAPHTSLSCQQEKDSDGHVCNLDV